MKVNLDFSWWGLTIFLMATTTLPVKMAAQFVGAKNNTMYSSGLAVLIATGMVLSLFYFLGNEFETYLLAFLLVLLVFKYVLVPPPGYTLWLGIIAFAIQLAVLFALISYGNHSGNYSLSF